MSAGVLHEGLVPGRQRSRARFAAGNKAYYPGQGPCRIDRIVQRVVDGSAMMFYHLTMLDDWGGELFIPVDKATALGLRSLMKSAEIPRLLEHLRNTAHKLNQRSNNNLNLLATRSAFDLAEVVGSLTEQKNSRTLKFREGRTLERATKLY
jgi:RNA polymerase-interacting CarD/CdnL/TRCF family regulator